MRQIIFMDFSREIEPDASVAGAFVFWGLFFYPPLHPPKKKKILFTGADVPPTDLPCLPRFQKRADERGSN